MKQRPTAPEVHLLLDSEPFSRRLAAALVRWEGEARERASCLRWLTDIGRILRRRPAHRIGDELEQPLDRVHSLVLRHQLVNAVLSLSSRDRELIVLRFAEERHDDELGRRLGLDPRDLERRGSRALLRIKRYLRRHYGRRRSAMGTELRQHSLGGGNASRAADRK